MSWPIVGIIAAAVGLAAAAPLGAWWLWWRLPKRQVDRLRLTIRDPKARADVEDNYRKTIGQLLGGAAVLIGAALAYMQFTQQQQTSQHQFSLQQQASRDLLALNDPRADLPALDPAHTAAHRRLVARFVRYHLGEAGPLSALDFWERRAWVPPTPTPIPSAAS